MSREKPDDDPRSRTDPPQSKGTDKPWERPGQKSQNPGEPDSPKPDLERWNDSKTH